MAYIPPNPNGQATSNSSAPVVIASDQSAVATQAQGNVASGAADSGNPVKVGGTYNATIPTLDDAQRGDVQLDASGNLKATLATKIDPVNDGITTYSAGNYITTISSATTTVVAAFPIIVKEIRVLGGTLGNVTVYDSTSASGTNPIPAFTPDKGQVLLSDVTFAVGCTVVTSAATILTVVWRTQ